MESRYLRTSCCPIECNIVTWGVLMTSMDDFNSRLYLKAVASNHRGPSVQCIGKRCKFLEYAEQPKHELLSGLGNNKSSSDLSRFKLFVIGGLSLVIC